MLIERPLGRSTRSLITCISCGQPKVSESSAFLEDNPTVGTQSEDIWIEVEARSCKARLGTTE